MEGGGPRRLVRSKVDRTAKEDVHGASRDPRRRGRFTVLLEVYGGSYGEGGCTRRLGMFTADFTMRGKIHGYSRCPRRKEEVNGASRSTAKGGGTRRKGEVHG